MNKTKKLLMAAASMALACALGVGATLAYMQSVPDELVNTFSAGDVNITLEEPNWKDDSKLIPCTRVEKDPTVTVLKDSEACYVFVKIDQAKPASWKDAGITFGMLTNNSYTPGVNSAWTKLEGVEGVWYRTQAATDSNVTLPVVFNRVDVPSSASSAQLEAAKANTITIHAYAIQQTGLNTAKDAWDALDV